MSASKHPTFEDELRERLQAYLIGASSLQGFSGWFFEECWDHAPRPDGLAARVESILAEHSSGYGSEEDVKRMLSGLLSPSRAH